ncbi:SGSM3 [Symbiodinium sp. CCMP2592]|nr:SGSM3 [Symbiodinium sp. CCMP2592]
MVVRMIMMILIAVIIVIIFFIIIIVEKKSARPRLALFCQHSEALQQPSRLDLGSSVRLSHQRFVHFDAGQAESLAKWLACFEALKAERTSGEEEASESKVSSPKAAYNARKRTFLYRKHSYRARKPKAPPGRVTASLPDETWVDVAPSRSVAWLSAWRNVQGCGSSDNELDILELPEEDWKPAEHFAAEGVEEVTAVVRAGLEPEDRQGAWPLLAAAAAKRRRKGRPYDSLVAEGKDLEENEAVRTIQADLHRTGMEDVDVCSLENVLLSFAATNPEIGYCQSMSFVAATLLHYLPEETAFWTLSGLLEDVLPEGYFASRMVGLRTDLRVLSVLLSQYLPSLADHLEAQEIDLSPITVNWFLCLFLNTLPAKWSHRVLDTVLYEGSVTLFRLALAILSFRSKELLLLG